MPPRLRLVLFLAFFLRSAVFLTAWVTLQDPTAFYAKDTWSYLQPAVEMTTNGSFTTFGAPELFRTPGYPLLLSLGLSLGHVEWVTIGLQILLGCATTYFVFRLALELFSDVRVATWSALAFSLEPLSIISSAWLLSDTLFTALLAAALTCLIRFVKRRELVLLALAGLLFAAAAYVRPIGYFLPLVLAGLLLLWALVKQERQLLLQSLAFGVLAFGLIGTWQLRNQVVAGYAGFSVAADYNLYFHQIAALRARQQNLPFYQVMDEMGFYSPEKYLRQNPEQQAWPVAQRYEFMRIEGVKAAWQNPRVAANIYLHGLAISLFDPGASEYLRLFRLYPQSGRILNGVVSEGVIATAINLVTEKPLLLLLTGALGVLLGLYYALSLLGLRNSVIEPSLSLWLLLTTGVYLVALSGGTLAASRFRLPMMIVVCILAGQGVSIALSRLHHWKEQLGSGFQLDVANLTRHP